tara:strand:+ start:248 stop:904 length:657 start_codon:yes stop_codon:yes gene_type:complete
MKLLFENWRKFISEGMKTVDDLVSFVDEEYPEYQTDLYVRIRKEDDGPGIDFTYAFIDENGEVLDLGWNDAFDGKITIVPAETFPEDGPCDGAYQVKWASAKRGWGPLLYDVAMEYATMHGNGLIADREEVTDRARPVWDYYLSNRGDVDHHQLDDKHNTLTPDVEKDNCDQYIASLPLGPGGRPVTPWEKNALSKRYTQEPTTITRLRELERLIDET